MRTHPRISALFIALMLIALIISTSLHAQTTAGTPPLQDAAKFAGVWRGQFDGLPGVDIGVSNEGGELTGAILFYLHTRSDVNSPWTSKPGPPGPMFNMKIEGDTLHFRVSHKGAHPPRTLNDPPVSFRLVLNGPDKATLMNDSESSGPPMVMIRSAY
jgi:hypothetical protein